MKVWFVIGAIVVVLYACDGFMKQRNIERRAAKEAACQLDYVCRSNKANKEARRLSFRISNPVASSTGVVYFKGQACSADCSGHVAGYLWAEERDVSKDKECSGESQSFIEGCEQYVSEKLSELDQQSDTDEPCTPGRFGNC